MTSKTVQHLTAIETIVNWLITIFFCFYPFYLVHNLEQEFISKNSDIRQYIPSDYEWHNWRKHALQLGILFGVYSLVGRFVTERFPEYRRAYYITISIVFLGMIFSLRALLLIVCHIALFFVIACTRKRPIVWLWSILVIGFLHARSDMQLDMFGIDPQIRNITKFTLLMVYLRCIDYGLTVIADDKDVSVPEFLHYMFYLPLFVNGPIIPMRDFMRDDNGKMKRSIYEILKDLTTCFIYAACFDVFIEYVYSPSSINWMGDLLKRQNSLQSLSIAWVHVQLFCVKYIIFFRFSGIFAKIDGFQPPKPPKCILMTLTFTDMWRTFDRGLYILLRNNIYLPIGGSRKGVFRQVLASLLCFAFVAYWHGGSFLIFVWGLINWLGIALESFAWILIKRFNAEDFINSSRRIKGICLSFSMLALMFSNFVFLTGLTPAQILLQQIFLSWKNFTIAFLALYVGSQSIMDVKNMYEST